MLTRVNARCAHQVRPPLPACRCFYPGSCSRLEPWIVVGADVNRVRGGRIVVGITALRILERNRQADSNRGQAPRAFGVLLDDLDDCLRRAFCSEGDVESACRPLNRRFPRADSGVLLRPGRLRNVLGSLTWTVGSDRVRCVAVKRAASDAAKPITGSNEPVEAAASSSAGAGSKNCGSPANQRRCREPYKLVARFAPPMETAEPRQRRENLSASSTLSVPKQLLRSSSRLRCSICL